MATEIVDFPIKNGDFPLLFVCSPEGIPYFWPMFVFAKANEPLTSADWTAPGTPDFNNGARPCVTSAVRGQIDGAMGQLWCTRPGKR